MPDPLTILLLSYVVFFVCFFSLFLLFYHDSIRFSLYRKAMCKLGFHKNKKRLGKLTVHKYYCESCKIARKHPKLTLIDGGKKSGNGE